jgi:hypothetical protein
MSARLLEIRPDKIRRMAAPGKAKREIGEFYPNDFS